MHRIAHSLKDLALLAAARHAAARRAWVLAALVLATSLACGPELTDPSPTDISGRWFSSDTARGVTDFELELSQAADGSLTGRWSGRGVEVDGKCSDELGCAPANDIVGSNTVFQVHIDLVGAGAFTGQVEGSSSFRGHLAGAALTFQRVVFIEGAGAPGSAP